MGRGGDGLKRRGRAQTAQARTRGGGEGLGTGMGQGGQEDRLAEADAAAGVRGSASAVGGRAHLLLVRAEQEDEQGLREALRQRGSFRLRGNDTAHGEAIGTWLRISKQFLRNCLEIRNGSRIGATKRPRGVKEVPIGCLLAPKKSARDTFCYFPNSFSRHFGELSCRRYDLVGLMNPQTHPSHRGT